MPNANTKWVAMVLKTGARIMACMTLQDVTRRCIACAMNTLHRKHRDQAGNSLYFCKHCGQHN